MSSPKRKPGRPATGQTPAQSVRVPQKRWDELAEKATKAGSNRAQVVNDLAAWYVGEDGAKLPKRPPAD